jgi:hypothetical protein
MGLPWPSISFCAFGQKKTPTDKINMGVKSREETRQIKESGEQSEDMFFLSEGQPLICQLCSQGTQKE